TDGVELACYLAVNAAALLRVGLPLVSPSATMIAVLGSALLWCGAFALFTLRYWPILTRARLDGKPG
ncbi:MAG: NnrS family protein, partial [Burkholderiaceae bacterium]